MPLLTKPLDKEATHQATVNILAERYMCWQQNNINIDEKRYTTFSGP